MMLQVQCPNDGEKCLVSDCDIKEEMVLLGDNDQNMQCTNCGFASNKKYGKDSTIVIGVHLNLNTLWPVLGIFVPEPPNCIFQKSIHLVDQNYSLYIRTSNVIQKST